MLPLFNKIPFLMTCSHFYRKGYYLGIDTDDYICIFCAKIRTTEADQPSQRDAPAGKNQRIPAPVGKSS